MCGMLQLVTTFFQEVIRADSSAGSFSQLGTYNSELCTCVVISVPPRSLRGCHGGSQSKPPLSLCHASPSCPMTICRREKNHCSQCFKGHILWTPLTMWFLYNIWNGLLAMCCLEILSTARLLHCQWVLRWGVTAASRGQKTGHCFYHLKLKSARHWLWQANTFNNIF